MGAHCRTASRPSQADTALAPGRPSALPSAGALRPSGAAGLSPGAELLLGDGQELRADPGRVRDAGRALGRAEAVLRERPRAVQAGDRGPDAVGAFAREEQVR